MNKANLIYMTGLSIDKNRLNDITENINYDKDYSYWLKKLQTNMSNTISDTNKSLGKIKGLTEKVIKKLIANFINPFDFFEDTLLANTVDIEANTKTQSMAEKIISPLSKIAFMQLEYFDDKTLLDNHEYLYKLIKKYDDNVKKYTNSDFFSLYISNQSDSIGLQPLSSVSKEKSFNIEHSYCDRPYFDNKYIDHVILKVAKDKLATNWKDMLTRTFQIHVYDILFSKVINDNKIEVGINKKKNKKIVSFAELILQDNEKIKKDDIINTLSDRNLFGVNLLSQVLYTLEKLSNEDRYNIIIDEKQNDEYHFLKEILEMSSSTNINISNNGEKPFISSKIYFSDGKQITKKSTELMEDAYFKYTNKFKQGLDNSYFNNSIEKIKEQIDKWSINTITNTDEDNLVNYIFTPSDGHEFVYIKIPIKIMLSLPVDINNNPNSDILLPYNTTNDNQTNIDVLTVGGIEHNRALSHLINKHRLEHKSKRLFGFMDNYFDFEHKINLDKRKSHQSSFNFFMGLNQPVSGWNYILDKRVDDSDGNSINSDVKFITFKLNTNTKQTINITSIYGFSAVASVLGVNMFIAELIKRKDINTKKGLFSEKFSSFFDDKQIYKEVGTTATLFFYKNLEDINENKDIPNSLYEHLQIILKEFPKDYEEIIREKLNEIENLISDKLDKKKYCLELNYDDYRDKIDNLTLEKIEVKIIDVIQFFLNKKSYSNVLNNNIKLFLKTLSHQDGGLIVSHIQRGRVTTKNS